jgi:hypothetical protein
MTVYKLTTWIYTTNRRPQLSDNLPNYSVELVKTGMSLCFIKQRTVAPHYAITVYLRQFFTAPSDTDVPLN